MSIFSTYSTLHIDPCHHSNLNQRIGCPIVQNATGNSKHIFSLLCFLGLASLFGSVRSQLFPTEFEVSQLNGTNGFVLKGVLAGDESGMSVANSGDINFDGFADFLIGAPAVDRAYVVFGGADVGKNGTVELSSLNGTNGFTIYGEKVGDNCAFSMAGVGDVNKDGIPDFAIGAHLATPAVGLEGAGKTYIVFGRPGLNAVKLSQLNGTDGFVVRGKKSGDNSGYSIAGARDINADGTDDFLIGAYRAAPAVGRERAGVTYVIFGKKGLGATGVLELSNLTNGCHFNGGRNGDESGYSVAGAGDVNADNIADILIGAHFADLPSGGRDRGGRTYVVFGSPGLCNKEAIELANLDNTTGIAFNGAKHHDFNGVSVHGAGDVNGDGIADMIFSAPGADPNSAHRAGRTYVVFGDKRLGSTPIDLQRLNGTNGFSLEGEMREDFSGRYVSGAGDVNDDGTDDFLIGARSAETTTGPKNAGKVYVVFGNPNVGAGGVLKLARLNGTSGFTVVATNASDLKDGAVSGGDDFNGDGLPDILIGAKQASLAGHTYVVFGRTSRLPESSSMLMTNGASLTSTETFPSATMLPLATSSLPSSSAPLSTVLTSSSSQQSSMPLFPSSVDMPSSLGLVLPVAIAAGVVGGLAMLGIYESLWRCKNRNRGIPEEGPEFESARELSTDYGMLSIALPESSRED